VITVSTGHCKQAQQLQLLTPAISLQQCSGRRLAVTRFPDLTSKTDANLFAVAQRIAAQDVLRTKGKPTRDFSLNRGRYRLLAPVRYNPGEAAFPGIAPQIRFMQK